MTETKKKRRKKKKTQEIQLNKKELLNQSKRIAVE